MSLPARLTDSQPTGRTLEKPQAFFALRLSPQSHHKKNGIPRNTYSCFLSPCTFNTCFGDQILISAPSWSLEFLVTSPSISFRNATKYCTASSKSPHPIPKAFLISCLVTAAMDTPSNLCYSYISFLYCFLIYSFTIK